MSVTVLDITAEQCPMTFVKTKIALSEIPNGDLLEVLLRAGEPLENVPRALEESGHKILSVENIEGDIYKIVVAKAGV
ncbi:transcriptional regulator [Fibrobacterales bacterium]|nr:transcriptional regulator [Fibrobacterales bacterium]